MVTLSKIYTRTGDDGSTALGDGARVAKDDARVEAYGTIDELNAVLGVLLCCGDGLLERDLLESVSNDLFDVGADLCRPPTDGEGSGDALRIAADHVDTLEAAIDRLNADLQPLRSFVLPGGTTVSAHCHLARTVCRRAERRVVTLARDAAVNPLVAVYLNRLSDLLFVLARHANGRGAGDVLWRPGRTLGDHPDG